MRPLALGGDCLGHRSLRINGSVEKSPPAPVWVLAARTRHRLFFDLHDQALHLRATVTIRGPV